MLFRKNKTAVDTPTPDFVKTMADKIDIGLEEKDPVKRADYFLQAREDINTTARAEIKNADYKNMAKVGLAVAGVLAAIPLLKVAPLIIGVAIISGTVAVRSSRKTKKRMQSIIQTANTLVQKCDAEISVLKREDPESLLSTKYMQRKLKDLFNTVAPQERPAIDKSYEALRKKARTPSLEQSAA
ncbi:MAG: hypothetical protein OXT65_01645 [Alphaproteobacteria bacterium]|nr:hypothetical protein [Alphaproteobacteria bacterium]